MPSYGVTAQGFLRKPVFAILEDFRAVQRAEISPRLDLSTVSVIGQVNGIFANELGIAWEQLEICYHAFDPDAAQDFLLTSLAKLTGTERRAAAPSLVVLECDLDDGTTLEAGTHFAAIDGDSDSLWTPVEDFTADDDDTFSVTFRSNEAGPIPAQPNTITVIHTAVVGWNSVTNPAEAVLGRTIDQDPTLRQRREAQLTAVGSATVDAIRADVLEVEGVESVEVFENDSNSEVDGMPPKSIEVLVFDGEIPAADDDEIAQAIWNSKAGGMQTIGDETGTALDSRERERTMRFTRPEFVEIHIAITVAPGPGYAEAGGDSALAAFIAAQARALHGVSDDVKWRRIDSLAFKFGVPDETVADVTAFTLDTESPAVGTTNISIGSRQIAAFDASRITVTSS
jgi:uncharacterized phage protein gp47/JayE